MRGSAVITPFTSVQIHTSLASSNRPKIVAEKSLPPRPSVVVLPSFVAPIKPVTTGVTPSLKNLENSFSARTLESLKMGKAFPKFSSVTRKRVASTATDFIPFFFNCSETMRAEILSPNDFTVSSARSVSSPITKMPLRMLLRPSKSSLTSGSTSLNKY